MFQATSKEMIEAYAHAPQYVRGLNVYHGKSGRSQLWEDGNHGSQD